MPDPLIPEPEQEALAAEFVLGTLGAEEAAAVRAAAARDAALAGAIAGWETRLAPLAALAGPAPPLPGLWSGIAAELGLERVAGGRAPLVPLPPVSRRAERRRRRGPLARLWRDADVWRAAALLLLLAGAGAVVAQRRAARPPGVVAVATLLAPGADQPAARADLAADGELTLRPAQVLRVANDESLAVWALPVGVHAPVLLGALPAAGGRVHAPALPDGSQVMVTAEPRGGASAGGAPGRTLFAGVITGVQPPADSSRRAMPASTGQGAQAPSSQ